MAKCEYSFFEDWSDRCRIKKSISSETDDRVGSDTYRNFCSYSEGHKKCPFYAAFVKNKKDTCYITSACVDAMGLNDDCKELTTLRGFRDNWLKKQPFGDKYVAEYYEIAPKIVSKIRGLGNQRAVFKNIYCDLVKPCESLIENGKNMQAFELYKNYTIGLKKEYL